MAVPSSGELRLYADIGVELGVPQSNVSLGSMTDSAGFTEPDAMSEFYGYSDYTAPTVNTNAATNVTGTSMTLNGFFQRASVESPGITEWGFYFGTNPNMTSNPKYSGATVAGNGFYMNRSGLNPSTTYYIWAYVVDSVQETQGARVTRATNAAFSPSFFNYDTNNTEGGYTSSQISGLSGTHYYYNPDSASYVSYGSFAHTSANQYKSIASMPTKSGNWSQLCGNSTNRAVWRTNPTLGGGGTNGIGFLYSDYSIRYFYDSSIPKYFVGRSVSGSSPGFSPNIAPDNKVLYAGESKWRHNSQSTTVNFTAGAYFESIFTFGYSSTPS